MLDLTLIVDQFTLWAKTEQTGLSRQTWEQTNDKQWFILNPMLGMICRNAWPIALSEQSFAYGISPITTTYEWFYPM